MSAWSLVDGSVVGKTPRQPTRQPTRYPPRPCTTIPRVDGERRFPDGTGCAYAVLWSVVIWLVVLIVALVVDRYVL